MKKLITLLLAVSFPMMLSAQGLISDLIFADVSSKSPYFNALGGLKTKGWINGYPDGSFRPYHTINRAEFTKIVVGMMGYDLSKSDLTELKFKDIDKNSWYAPYLRSAVSNGLIGGYPDGTFRPADQISFVEAAKILAIAKKFPLVSQGDDQWYAPYVKALDAEKAIPETVNTFAKKISRGEMADIIWTISSDYVMARNQSYEQLWASSDAWPKSIVFDACGHFADYQNENWYANLKSDITLIGFSVNSYDGDEWISYNVDGYLESEISELCYSPEAQLVVIAFDAAHIFKYDIETRLFYPAVPSGEMPASDFVVFGKRVGNVIPFNSSYGDAGCMSKHTGEYDFVANTVKITGDQSYCVDN
jgi:hypothetical protein